MIPRPNHEHHEILRIPCQYNENHESLIILLQNNENHEIPRIPSRITKIMKINVFHIIITKILKKLKIQRQNKEHNANLNIPLQN